MQHGIVCMLVASFCFAVSGAVAGILKVLPTAELVLFRNLIGVGFIIFTLWKKPPVQTGGKLGLLIFRGVIGTLALFTFFYGISKIGLAVSITYQQSYPIFLAVLSYWIYKEKLSWNEWLFVLIGFTGVCLIFIPQMQVSMGHFRNHILGISNALMTGLAYFSIKGLSKNYDGRIIVLSFMLSGIVLPIFFMILSRFYFNRELDFLLGVFIIPHQEQWMYLLLLGISALIGQIYLTKAFSFEKSGVIAAAGYSNVVFSIFFGIILGDPRPSYTSFLGMALIIFSGVLISFYKSKS